MDRDELCGLAPDRTVDVFGVAQDDTNHLLRHVIGQIVFNDSELPDSALALVHEIIRSESGPVLIDAVGTQDEFLKGLTSSGWIIERPFQRMRLGGATAEPTELPFAVAGPEYG